MKKIRIILLIFVFSVAFLSKALAASNAQLYETAKQAVKSGDREYAFMCFRSILHRTFKSQYHREALFATGEYFYSIGDYRSAEKSFSDFIDYYSEDKALPFAIVYLLKINNYMQIQKASEDLRKQAITFKQLSLLFSEFKELTYTSAFNLHYKAIYFIDRIEIYINEELFEKIYF